MGVLLIVLSVIDILVCISLVTLVLFQDSNDQGMGSLAGNSHDSFYIHLLLYLHVLMGSLAGNSHDSFYSNNKGRTKDVLMRRLTIILAIVFVVLTVTIGLILA